jgi:hypothetical protein
LPRRTASSFSANRSSPSRSTPATAFAGAAVQLGIAAKTIDGLIGSLRAGQAGGYEWVSTPFFIDLALRRP